MAYSSPASVSTATTITSSWGNSVKAAADFLANPPACQVHIASASQSISDATLTTLTFDAEDFDTNAMHSTSVNTSRITFNTAGLYVVSGYGVMTDNNDYQAAYLLILKNGATALRQSSDNGVSDGGGPKLNISGIFKFAAADYVELRAFHNNTANVSRAINVPSFEAVWVGLG